MVFASDSRTNAGVDQIASFRKMRTFTAEADRVIVILSSGNLSITQTAIHLMEHPAETGVSPTPFECTSMFEVAELAGNALREARERDGPHMAQNNIDAGASFIVGGQIRGERQRLFHIYNEGNFIEATPETPYFQTGESKYGKPVLDRVVNRSTGLLDAAKCVLVSFDSTMRSNISVGLPIDLALYRNGELRMSVHHRIMKGDPYFEMIHTQWGEGLKRVFAELPNPQWD
jgi:putative proteasome-type protease